MHILGESRKTRTSNTRTVKNPDFRLMEVISGLAARYGKSYCFPTQEKLLELLAKFTGRRMSRSTLCRHLNALESGLWLSRTRRHTHDRRKGYTFRSTLYKPMWRYCQRLHRNARAIAGLLGAHLRSHAGGIRVPLMAQNMTTFLKKVIPQGP